MSSIWDGAEVISVCTRKQLIEDGVLVDLTPNEIVQQSGFRLPVALGAAVLTRVTTFEPLGCPEAGPRGR